jgi:hypothetical protein
MDLGGADLGTSEKSNSSRVLVLGSRASYASCDGVALALFQLNRQQRLQVSQIGGTTPNVINRTLTRGLEGKKIRLKNNKLRLSAALHRAIHNSISQNGLAGYLRRCAH